MQASISARPLAEFDNGNALIGYPASTDKSQCLRIMTSQNTARKGPVQCNNEQRQA